MTVPFLSDTLANVIDVSAPSVIWSSSDDPLANCSTADPFGPLVMMSPWLRLILAKALNDLLPPAF
ncbi:hypothetical protein LKX83_25090 [Cohnella sp. REN36]|nr:hypothetical protein [Cohnella sp. REN36]